MQFLLGLASFWGATGVGIGAFGAHGLASILEANGRSDTFRTGTLYHLIHALAILGVALLARQVDSPLLTAAGWAFSLGIVLFSGSLYALSITNVGLWGAVAPLGGVAYIVGWILLGVVAWQNPA